MNDQQMRNLLSSPQKVMERMQGQGWREWCLSPYQARFDLIAQLPTAEERAAAAKAALAEDGWATRLMAWCREQQMCLRWHTWEDGRKTCAHEAYPSLTVAAIAYMLIDVRAFTYPTAPSAHEEVTS